VTRKPPSRPLRPEEQAVWRQVARTAKPLDPRKAQALGAPLPPVPPEAERGRAGMRAHASPAAIEAGRARSPAPADRGAEKKIRRGRVEVEAKIDLHGLTAMRARGELLGFLHRSRSRGMRTVLVITGKGAGARALDESRFEPWNPDARPLPGVLRRSFRQWMAEGEFAALASGWATAHARHGGAGAFYVMLRG
jgi:DNA-nicking Smr family endonuclease